MQELGVWITESGTTEAIFELESDNIEEWDMPSWASGALKGAAAGAATGAAAGPYGALIGAAAGGALGAATSASTPAPTSTAAAAKPGASKPASKPAAKPADGNRAQVIQALQQFAAIVPVLVQLVAASGGGAKEVGSTESIEAGEGAESFDWGPEAFEGTWTQP